MIKGKRGFAPVLIGIISIVALLIVGIFFVVLEPVSDRIYNRIEPKLDNQNAKNIITGNQEVYNDWLDGFFVFMFGGLWLATILVGWFSDYGKFWIFVMIFLMLFVLWAAGNVSDYWSVVSEKDFVAGQSTFPGVYYILDNLMWVILVMVGSGVLVAALKPGD